MARNATKGSAPVRARRPVRPPRTVRRRPRHEAQVAFEALAIEGGLLSPEWLARVAQLTAGQQAETDYRIPKGLSLRDELGRYWRIAQAYWSDFAAGLSTGDKAPLSERFVRGLLSEVFGFTSLAAVAPVVVHERSFPIGFAARSGAVPIVIAPAGSGLETLDLRFGDGGRKRNAFGLVQDALNASDTMLWGIVTDGLQLRIVRDNVSLTRPAWIAADLERIFREERYADFAALWLLMHETRFGQPEGTSDRSSGESQTACSLERWKDAGKEEGTRARELLRGGVRAAIEVLGQGFLDHRDNVALRLALAEGRLTTVAYFGELLRLVYRLIFLITVEERGLLHVEATPDPVRDLYAKGYGVRRLRDRAVKRSAHDRHSDLWEAHQVVLRGIAQGEPRLGLPALGGIFGPEQCRWVDACKLENRAILDAVFRLSWLRDASGLARVNWRDMGPEELGSVYEGLLELDPVVSDQCRRFALAAEADSKGNERKKSGSYYTPDSLVQVLLDSALDPVIADTLAAHPSDPVEALLRLAIVDPACGSGHFLLAAARRLAVHVARLSADGTPSPKQYRHALRLVVGRCIHGVDLNPMAVELCKVSLWMEALEPGLPLTFLDSHIRQGNALIGATPALMKEGIPEAAWEPIEGDDKKTASELKRRNKKAAAGQGDFTTLWAHHVQASSAAVLERFGAVEAAADTDAPALAQKVAQWADLLASEPYRREKLIADTWCAAFVWPKVPGELAAVAPTAEVWRQLEASQGEAHPRMVAEVEALAELYSFFHWHLAFPQVFARGGFDVVLGNPPWEQIELKEEEFFATRSPEIAKAANAAARKRMIATLPVIDPDLYARFRRAQRTLDGQTHFMRSSGRYPMCARGRINSYAIFAEHNRSLLQEQGRAGFIVPPGLATDDTTKAYFQDLVAKNALVALYEFENEEFLFAAIDHRVRFILISVARSRTTARGADLSFGNRSVAMLADQSRHFSLTSEDFATLNPNTRTCPTFRSRRDADINLKMYRGTGILWREQADDGNPWGLRFMQGVFNMASDSELFRTRMELESAGWTLDGNHFVMGNQRALPLIEAKMVHMFDHRFGTYEGQTEAQSNQNKLPELDDAAHADPHKLTLPYYWVAESEVDATLEDRWSRGWFLGWRDICRSTDQRTLIAALIPRAGVGHKFPLLLAERDSRLIASLYANVTSLALDYAARQKVGGTSLAYFLIKQFPILAPSAYSAVADWHPEKSLRDWLFPRVLELTYTAWDLEPFARDCGYDGPPFRWDPIRRSALRAELDAAFFHLYGIARDDVDYILETFPTVRGNEVDKYGEYRTKRLILEAYDALAAATRSGRSYQSPLFPNEAS